MAPGERVDLAGYSARRLETQCLGQRQTEFFYRGYVRKVECICEAEPEPGLVLHSDSNLFATFSSRT